MNWCLGKFCSLAPADQNIRKQMSSKPRFVTDVPHVVFDNLHWSSQEIKYHYGLEIREGDVIQSDNCRCLMIWPFQTTRCSGSSPLNITLEVTRKHQGSFLRYCSIATTHLDWKDVICDVSLDDSEIENRFGKFDKRWECFRYEKISFSNWIHSVVYCSSISHDTELGREHEFQHSSSSIYAERIFKSSITPRKSMVIQISSGFLNHEIVVEDEESISALNNDMAANSFPDIVDISLPCEMLTCSSEKITNYALRLAAGMRLVALSDDGKIFQKNYANNMIVQVPDVNKRHQSYWAWRTTLDFVISVYDIFPSYVMLWILEWFDVVRDNPQHVTMKCINGVRASVTKLLENKGKLSEKSCLYFEQ